MKWELIGTGAAARPVPRRFAPIVKAVLARAGGRAWINSCARTQAAVDFARKRGAVLSSQKELYDGWVKRLPGFNPANPPGRSTHEGFSDGVVYPGPIGRALRWWQWGLDIGGDVDGFIRAARALGWIVVRPYDVASERHHVNFVKPPFFRKGVLRPGFKGKRVRKLRRWLVELGCLNRSKLGGTVYGPAVEKAVRRLQKRYGLEQDGVFGPHTRAQLKAALRGKRQKERSK